MRGWPELPLSGASCTLSEHFGEGAPLSGRVYTLAHPIWREVLELALDLARSDASAADCFVFGSGDPKAKKRWLMANLPSFGAARHAAIIEGRSFADPAWDLGINGGPNLAWLDRNLDKGFRVRMVRRLKERSPSVANDKWWRATVTGMLAKYQQDGSYVGEGAHPAERELLRLFLGRRTGDELLAAFDRAFDQDCRIRVAARYRQSRHIGGMSSWMRPRVDPESLAVTRIKELMAQCPELGYADAVEFALEQTASGPIEFAAWAAGRKRRAKDGDVPSCGRLHLTKRGAQLLQATGRPAEEAITVAVTKALEAPGALKPILPRKRVSPAVTNADEIRRWALARVSSHGRVSAAWLAEAARKTLLDMKDDDPELVALLDRMAVDGLLVKQEGVYIAPKAAQAAQHERLVRNCFEHLPNLCPRPGEGISKLRLVDGLKARFQIQEQLVVQILDLAIGQGKIEQSDGLYYLPEDLKAREDRRYHEALTRLDVADDSSEEEVVTAWRKARKDLQGLHTAITQLDKAKDLVLDRISKRGKTSATA